MNWYVVNSYSGQELSVQKLFEAFRDGSDAEGLAFKGRVGEVRVPTHDVTSMSGGRRRVTKSKNFPGYVLVEADMDQSLMNALATIPGVIRFLSDRHGKPEPLSQEEVNRILGVGDENGPSDGGVVIDPYVKGDTVRIKAGPFKDFDGNVEDVQTEKCKLKVMVSVFGRSTPVELGFDQVERLS